MTQDVSKDQPNREDQPRGAARSRLTKLLIVLAGIALGQAVLYGPSLVGKKILLPLELLSEPGVYMARTPEIAKLAPPPDICLTDLIFLFEPARRYAASEWHAGRVPLWAPYQYTGAPFVWPKYSPFLFFQSMFASPVILAWEQLFAAIVAGLGTYLFCRRVLGVNFWAAAIPAWCYPMTGFFVFWSGYPTSMAAYWLPWSLLAVDKVARGASARSIAGLAAVTCLVLISGHVDVAGQVLLVSGLYSLWRLGDTFGRQCLAPKGRGAVFGLVAGWVLGFLLAAPHLLPMFEYAQTGARMIRRSEGAEDRPPSGLVALPQVVLPDLYGSTRTGSLRITNGNQIESAAATYSGLLATLFLAPLAFCSRRHRSSNVMWIALGFFGLSWCLNVPGFVQVLRLPGLRMMSHNRLVLITSFAILALASVGLDVLLRGNVQWRRWFWFPATILAGLCGWCMWRSIHLPEPLATELPKAFQENALSGWLALPGAIQVIQDWFVDSSIRGAVLCAAGLAGWLLLRSQKAQKPWGIALLAIVLVADLCVFATGRSSQADPSLYYPKIEALEAIAKAPPGRVVGYRCFPPAVITMAGLKDIRGYDSLDPGRTMDLMGLARDPASPVVPYAITLAFAPKATVRIPDDVKLSPVMDMLNVRYVVFRTPPPAGSKPFYSEPGYCVFENHSALERVFVPGRVETVQNDHERLEKLGSEAFNAREVAYVEVPTSLPNVCRGTADIIDEIPGRIRVSLHLDTPALVVLADLWNTGWRAYLDGKPVPILRTNHALRGVEAPAGAAILEFRYAPASLTWGLRLAALAIAVVIVLLFWAKLRRKAAA